jgi:hypothetical protein
MTADLLWPPCHTLDDLWAVEADPPERRGVPASACDIMLRDCEIGRSDAESRSRDLHQR